MKDLGVLSWVDLKEREQYIFFFKKKEKGKKHYVGTWKCFSFNILYSSVAESNISDSWFPVVLIKETYINLVDK